MARAIINNSPGTADTLKVGADKINAMTDELYTADTAAATPSIRTLGTGAQQAAAGNDGRFSDQRVPLDGSVTTAKIVDQNVTAAKLSFSAGPRFMARAIAGAGPGTEITPTQLTAALDTVTRTTKGLAPPSGGTSGTTNFLREDLTWVAVGAQAPSGAAGGQLGGTYPNPDVRGIRETSGPTALTVGSIPDGAFVRRSGTGLIGDDVAVLGEFVWGAPGFPVASTYPGRRIVITGLGNQSVLAKSDGSDWRPEGGMQLLNVIAPAATLTGSTAEQQFTGQSFTSAINFLKANDGLLIKPITTYSASTGNNVARVKIGGTSVYTPAAAANFLQAPSVYIYNNASKSAQYVPLGLTTANGSITTSPGFATFTVNTATTALVVDFYAQNGDAATVATLRRVEAWWVAGP